MGKVVGIAISLWIAAVLVWVAISIDQKVHRKKPEKASMLTQASEGWKTSDPQVAAGDWTIEVQIPPCDIADNLEIIWPPDSGGPVRIECHLMPVKTR